MDTSLSNPRQIGCVDTRPEQALDAADSADGATKMGVHRGRIGVRRIGEIMLGFGPNKFDRVELRRIGWKAMNMKSRVSLDKVSHLAAAVNLAAVPQQDDRTWKVTHEVLQECENFQTRDVDGMVFHEEPQVLTLGRDGKCADGGNAIMVLAMTQDRGLPPGSPRFTKVGNEQKSAFVEENQMGAKFSGFFLNVATQPSSNVQYTPRRVEWLGAPASDNSNPDRAPTISKLRWGHRTLQNAFQSVAPLVSESTSRWHVLPRVNRRATARKVFFSGCRKVLMDDRELVLNAMPSDLLSGGLATIEPLNSARTSVVEPPNDTVCRNAARRWLVACAPPIDGNCQEVSCPIV